jgi:hypothetical protein
MNLAELRIGNFIHQGKHGEGAISAHKLYQYELFRNGQPSTEHYSEWRPIELNAKWLLSYGFEKSSRQDYAKKIPRSGGFVLRITLSKEGNIGTVIQGEKKDGFNLLSHTLKYVHQLQNMFFALAGEELDLK